MWAKPRALGPFLPGTKGGPKSESKILETGSTGELDCDQWWDECGARSGALACGTEEALDFRTLRRHRGQPPQELGGFLGRLRVMARAQMCNREVESRLIEVRIERQRALEDGNGVRRPPAVPQ